LTFVLNFHTWGRTGQKFPGSVPGRFFLRNPPPLIPFLTPLTLLIRECGGFLLAPAAGGHGPRVYAVPPCSRSSLSSVFCHFPTVFSGGLSFVSPLDMILKVLVFASAMSVDGTTFGCSVVGGGLHFFLFVALSGPLISPQRCSCWALTGKEDGCGFRLFFDLPERELLPPFPCVRRFFPFGRGGRCCFVSIFCGAVRLTFPLEFWARSKLFRAAGLPPSPLPAFFSPGPFPQARRSIPRLFVPQLPDGVPSFAGELVFSTGRSKQWTCV